MHLILKNNWQDSDFIEKRCSPEGFESLKAELIHHPPEKVEQLSGIPTAQLEMIAELFGRAETASVFYAMGITQHTTGTDNVRAIANLQMLCGNIGIPGGGVNPLRGQNNVQGACDMGGLPNVFPGYLSVTDQQARASFENAWQTTLSGKNGRTISEMLAGAVDGSIKSMIIMGENPMISDPDISNVRKALEALDLLVVQDIFLTETAELADVILPAASFAEKEGVFTNTERRAQKLNKALSPPGKAKEDWQIIQELARAMGGNWTYESASEIAEEICDLVPFYKGITWNRLEGEGLQWPCPDENHPGTPILHRQSFAHGLGQMVGVPYKEPAELPDEIYPLVLTTGRVLQQFHSGTMTRKTEGFNELASPMVMISVETAEELKINNSELVEVSTRRGKITVPAFITRRIGKGTIYIPFHYKEAAANLLTNPSHDPIAGIPEYKACAARIQRLLPVRFSS